MPHLITTLVATMLVVLPITASAQTVEEATSHISFTAQDGIVEWQIENRTYDVVSFWPVGTEGPRTLLIDQTSSSNEILVGSVRKKIHGVGPPRVTVTASAVLESGTLAPAWTIEEVADSGGIRRIGDVGKAYMTTLYGGDDLLDARSFFSLSDGNWLLTTNVDPAILEMLNSDDAVRMVGVETISSATLRPFFMDNPNLVGFLIYASLKGPIDGFSILTRTPLLEIEHIEQLVVAPEVIWISSNGEEPTRELTYEAFDSLKDVSGLSGLTLRITFAPEVWIEVPVSGDRLDLENARMSDHFSLQRIQN